MAEQPNDVGFTSHPGPDEDLMRFAGVLPTGYSVPEDLPDAAQKQVQSAANQIEAHRKVYTDFTNKAKEIRSDKRLSEQGKRERLAELGRSTLDQIDTDKLLNEAHVDRAKYKLQIGQDPFSRASRVPTFNDMHLEQNHPDGDGSPKGRLQEQISEFIASPRFAVMLQHQLARLDQLDDIERGQVLHEAVQRGDDITVMAIRSAQESQYGPMGSYVVPEIYAEAMEQWQRQKSPTATKAVDAIDDALRVAGNVASGIRDAARRVAGIPDEPDIRVTVPDDAV